MKKYFDGYWIWLSSEEKPNYAITGKYLFFFEDKDKLIEIARNEIENHGFHEAKVNEHLLEGQTEHVLCLYYKDDSRNHELAERNKQEYCVKYRYWKSDEATLKGQYSSEFLDKLPESERKDFTGEKEVIEFRDGHCAMNPPSDKDFTESLSRSPNESLQGTEPNGEFTEPQRTRLKRAVLNIVQGIDEHQEI